MVNLHNQHNPQWYKTQSSFSKPSPTDSTNYDIQVTQRSMSSKLPMSLKSLNAANDSSFSLDSDEPPSSEGGLEIKVKKLEFSQLTYNLVRDTYHDGKRVVYELYERRTKATEIFMPGDRLCREHFSS